MLIALFPLVSQSQNWTVGTPVNMVLNSNLFHSSGCFPTADQHFTVNGSTVSGVNYYLYVNSAPLDSVYIFPGMDTLATGDSILIPSGGNYFALYFFNYGGLLDMSIKAVGTPTTVGQVHPCQTSSLWMSNLMICDEELTPIINNSCAVAAGGTNLMIEIFGTNSYCAEPCTGIADASVTGGTFPYSYLWSNGETTVAITDLCAGTYSLTVTDANSATATANVVITSPPAFVVTDTISPASCASCADGSISLGITGGTPPYSITWNTGATTTSITNQLPGNYTYTIIDTLGCTTFGNITIEFTLGITNSDFNTTIQIYPNPTFEKLTISGDLLKNAKIEISDLLGRKLISELASTTQTSINVSTLPSSAYILSVQLSDGSKVIKHFIKN